MSLLSSPADLGRRPPAASAGGASPSVFAALSSAPCSSWSPAHNPLEAYAEIVRGSLSPDDLPNTLNWAAPLVGMTLGRRHPAARRHDQSRRRRPDGHRRAGRARSSRFISRRHGAFVRHRSGLALADLAAASTLRSRLGARPARHPDADLESAPELPGDRRHLLHRRLSPSRRTTGLPRPS